MKVLANETKRILAVLLSVAMIFAYVPNNVVAYADEVSGNDTEEAAVTEEDSVAQKATNAVEDTSGTDDGEEAADPLLSQGDLEVIIIPDDSAPFSRSAAYGQTAIAALAARMARRP